MKRDTLVTITVPPWQPTTCIIRHNQFQVNIITTITYPYNCNNHYYTQFSYQEFAVQDLFQGLGCPETFF